MKYSQVCFFAILATALRPAESSTKAAFVATPIAAVIPHKASYIAPYDDTYDISHVSAYSGAYAAARQYGYASPYNYKSNSIWDHHYSAEQQYSPWRISHGFAVPMLLNILPSPDSLSINPMLPHIMIVLSTMHNSSSECYLKIFKTKLIMMEYNRYRNKV